jgi:hypothetical protein
MKNPCIGGCLTPLLNENEKQLIPQDFHEQANKCSIVQALMKQ